MRLAAILMAFAFGLVLVPTDGASAAPHGLNGSELDFEGKGASFVGYRDYRDYRDYEDDDDAESEAYYAPRRYVPEALPQAPVLRQALPPAAQYGPSTFELLPPPRPASCGVFRYWDGERCVDARFFPPYIGPRW